MAWRKLLVLMLAVIGCWQFGHGAWIQAKALLAQQLIAIAWQQANRQTEPVRPWPWADTWPVARLQMTDRGVDLYILQGADGSSLAFGPGHLNGSAIPGTAGFSVVGGHRDTHFRFLESLKAGDTFEVTPAHAAAVTYRVQSIRIVDSTRDPLLAEPNDDRLMLVTCYPFDALTAGGPLRYLVTAEPLRPINTDLSHAL
jgi:sortase A